MQPAHRAASGGGPLPGRAAGSAARARSRARRRRPAPRSARASDPARRLRAASSVPITATATKLTELLIRKKATERRAMRSAGMPPSCRIQAPSARPAGAAGGHDRAHRERRPADLPARPPRHVTAEDRPEHQHVGGARTAASKATASAIQPGLHPPAWRAPRRAPAPGRRSGRARPSDGDDLQRPAQQPPRIEFARHR